MDSKYHNNNKSFKIEIIKKIKMKEDKIIEVLISIYCKNHNEKK